MRKNHSKIVCIKLVHLPYYVSFFSNGQSTSFWIKTFSTFLCLSLQNRSCTCLGTCSDRC